MKGTTARMLLLACGLALAGGIAAACSDGDSGERVRQEQPAGPSFDGGGYLGGGGGKTDTTKQNTGSTTSTDSTGTE